METYLYCFVIPTAFGAFCVAIGLLLDIASSLRSVAASLRSLSKTHHEQVVHELEQSWLGNSHYDGRCQNDAIAPTIIRPTSIRFHGPHNSSARASAAAGSIAV